MFEIIGFQGKVIGIQGLDGDIASTETGLASTLTDFTTFGLVAGRWIKIDGFAPAVLNDWARIVAVTKEALTLDNLPTGWVSDAGAGRAIKVWFGDTIPNARAV